MNNNPFLTKGYLSPEYFCDREVETGRIISAVNNQRNLTLISLRRMGKTGLIHHAFHQLKKESKEVSFIYTDIYSATNLESFITLFGNSVIRQLQSPTEKIFSRIASVFKGIRPSITLDPMSGQPVIDFNVKNERDASVTLENIFKLLNEEKNRKVIAIDEFQQITAFAEKNTEALLRSFIQETTNSSFIFSGSSRNILLSMFSDYKRPFYQSGELMELSFINPEKYVSFIREKFWENHIGIDADTAGYLLNQCRNHTFYVQFVCNRLYGSVSDTINKKDVDSIIDEILSENEPVYYSYRNLLTEQQFKVLAAIGREGVVKLPNGIEFTKSHHLGSQSSVSSALKALVSKDLVYQDPEGYHVYDQFLSLWLNKKY